MSRIDWLQVVIPLCGRAHVLGRSPLVEQDHRKRHAARWKTTMISRDEAFAQGWRLAWRNIPLIATAVVLAFLCMSALGYFAEQVDHANKFNAIRQADCGVASW